MKTQRWTVLIATAAVSCAVPNLAKATSIPSAGLNVWLEAGEGYTKDGSDFISNWADQSGSSNNAVQITAANQPKWVDNALNGYPVVRFDGSNDYLYRYSYAHGSNDITAVVVVKRNGNPSGYHNILLTGQSSYTTVADFAQIYGTNATPSKFTGNFVTSTLDINSTVSFSNTDYQLVVLRKSNAATGDSKLWVDGTLAGSGTGNQTLSNGYLLGSFNNSTLNGDIAEVLIYNAALSTSDRQLAEGVLAWKFDLQGNLPNDHPWKNVNPVPEPGSFAMLLFGTMMLWFFRSTSRRFC